MKIPGNSRNISDVFEIRIQNSEWYRILHCSRKHHISYSWVVRLCLFRFLQKRNPMDADYFRTLSELKEEYRDCSDLHRHCLCLYGADADGIRLIAGRMGLSINMLVRLAVKRCLGEIFKDTSRKYFVQQGIKIYRTISSLQYVLDFHTRILKLERFPPEAYRY